MSGVEPDVSGTVLDSEAGELIRSYADALVNAAGDEGEAVVSELEELIADVIAGNPQFASILGSPTMAQHDKARVLTQVFEGRALPMVYQFLQVLNRHNRLELLGSIGRAARATLDRKHGRKPVSVTSAAPLDEGQRAALTERLAKFIHGTPILSLSVDPSLIGGLVVQVGDHVYDASVRSQLARLRQRLVEGNTHEIQGRRDHFSHPA